MVLMIQVPLKQKKPMRFAAIAATAFGGPEVLYCCLREPGDVEEAVIGHGAVEGPFSEIDGLAIERDDRYPIRVTVQFYKATSNGVVSEQDMADIARQIRRVYEQADYVGSLVVRKLESHDAETLVCHAVGKSVYEIAIHAGPGAVGENDHRARGGRAIEEKLT